MPENKKNKRKTTSISALRNIKHNFRFEILFFAVTILVILACVSPVLRHPGWPQNHEGLAFVDRTLIYADHIRHGDILPIWSSSDAFGMGTPLPLFYHKTFYFVSSILFLLIGSIKAAIVLAIICFMFVGAYGMRLCVGKLTKQAPLLIIVPQLFLLSNYVFSNWLVRGAMAEFSAMMLIPWLFWWCLKLLKDKIFSLAIIPIFFLLFNAHNVTTLFALVPLLLGVGIFLFNYPAKLTYVIRRGLVATCLLAVLFAPQLLLQKVFLTDYDPSKITQSGYIASNNFRDVGGYLHDTHYTWLQNWMQLSVQLDVAITATVVVSMVALAVIVAFDIKGRRQAVKKYASQGSVIFLITTLVIFLFLQTRLSKVVYTTIAPLEFLQFPWRLLSYITPLGILLIAAVLSRFSTIRLPLISKAVPVAYLLVFLLLSPLLHHFKYDFYSQQYVDSRYDVKQSGIGDQLGGIGEYLPRVDRNGKELSSLDTVSLYQGYYKHKNQAETLSGDCHISEAPRRAFEQMTIKLVVRCTKPSLVALPISYNRFTTVKDQTSSTALKPLRHLDDPRLLVQLPVTSKGHEILVQLPTISRIVGKVL